MNQVKRERCQLRAETWLCGLPGGIIAFTLAQKQSTWHLGRINLTIKFQCQTAQSHRTTNQCGCINLSNLSVTSDGVALVRLAFVVCGDSINILRRVLLRCMHSSTSKLFCY